MRLEGSVIEQCSTAELFVCCMLLEMCCVLQRARSCDSMDATVGRGIRYCERSRPGKLVSVAIVLLAPFFSSTVRVCSHSRVYIGVEKFSTLIMFVLGIMRWHETSKCEYTEARNIRI